MKASPLVLLATAASLVCLASCKTPEPNRFDLADLDSDGKLSRTEVHHYMVTSIFVSRDANKDKLMSKAEWNEPADDALFMARDTNKDGMVSLEEAKDYSKKHGVWDPAIADADKNKDGLITREEAAAYADSKMGPIR